MNLKQVDIPVTVGLDHRTSIGAASTSPPATRLKGKLAVQLSKSIGAEIPPADQMSVGIVSGLPMRCTARAMKGAGLNRKHGLRHEYKRYFVQSTFSFDDSRYDASLRSSIPSG